MKIREIIQSILNILAIATGLVILSVPILDWVCRTGIWDYRQSLFFAGVGLLLIGMGYANQK